MRTHRFYINPDTEIKHQFWLHDKAIIHQWRNVLRFQTGQQVVLFDGIEVERLYNLDSLTDKEAKLTLITEFERQLPAKDLYLCWSLLKKDKNDWILQKATELGVSHFVPIVSQRAIANNFDADRALKIVTEASEQSGRSDIPRVRSPLHLTALLDQFTDRPLIVAQQGTATSLPAERSLGLLIGPEGGWSTEELGLFKTRSLPHIGLGKFTLRAETAAIVAASKILCD